MFGNCSVSKCLIIISVILLTASCTSTHTIHNIKDKEMPSHMVGKKIKVYMLNGSSVEFAIQKADSIFLYGENDNPKIRRDEVAKIEVPETKVQKFSRHYLVGGLILMFLSMMFAP